MPYFRAFAIGALPLIIALSLLSCAGKRPPNLGVVDSRLADCPPSPNCVSSDAEDSEHKVPPLLLNVSAIDAWRVARQIVSQWPRTHIVNESRDYLHAECQSAVFGFVDDLELHLRTDRGVIAIRSAARLGKSDFGVNRQRVEELRSALIDLGVVQ
jgi:uncharacterized protein (DUF1499 family)